MSSAGKTACGSSELPTRERIHTWGRTLAKAETNIREALAAWHGNSPDEYSLDKQFDIDGRVSSAVSAQRHGEGKRTAHSG